MDPTYMTSLSTEYLDILTHLFPFTVTLAQLFRAVVRSWLTLSHCKRHMWIIPTRFHRVIKNVISGIRLSFRHKTALWNSESRRLRSIVDRL